MPSPLHYMLQPNPIIAVQANSPAAWFRFGMGITITGSGVSQWDDQSSNARHLKQGTDTNRPAKQADGSILFDGVDNFLATDPFTQAQPFTAYLLLKQVTWSANGIIWIGLSENSILNQVTGTPQIGLNAGAAVAANGNLAVGAYGVVAAVFNGAGSSLKVNSTAETTGDAGAGNANGMGIGARPSTAANPSNIQVKEVILFSTAHDADTRTRIIRYLAAVGSLAV